MPSTLPKKVCLVSLGCPKNLVDAEFMLGSLQTRGYELTTEADTAEIIVVNTCSFIEGSKSESIDRLLEMAEYKKSGRCRLLIATGCLSQRYGDVLAQEMPEVDQIVGTGEFDRLPEIILNGLGEPSPAVTVSSRQILPDPDQPRIRSNPAHLAYLKISEGCSHRCSFCIIPKIRGTLASRPLDSVIQEASQLVREGVQEINLIAQDLNEYGRDLKDGTSLTRLIQLLDEIPGDFWVRPLYMYPLLFNDALIKSLAQSRHWNRYIDIPLQHINNDILRSMKRGSSSDYIRRLLGKLKEVIPDITIRTTFIVGYPGETDAQFEELCDFVQEMELDRVGVFSFSQEEGTEAGTFEDSVPPEAKEERRAHLMDLQKNISKKKNEALVGKTLPVLVDGPSEDSDLVLQGRLSSQAPEIDGVTYLSEGIARPGEFVSARIIEAHDYDLVASLDDIS